MFSAGSASSAGYYTAGGGGEASYYLDATTREEPPGQWSGQLATKLGLEGQVDPKDFKSLLEEFTAPDGTTLGQPARQYKTTDQLVAAALEREPDALPERVEEIRREAEGKTRTATLGWDYTFAPPKSVTVAHTALWRAEIEAEKAGDLDAAREARAGRMTIEGLMWEANAAGLAYADANLQSRPGWHGGRGTAGRWVDAGSTARASYFQHTTRASREGQPEEREWTVAPQLHIHNVFINRALNGDGEYRAIDGDTVYGIRRAMSAVADHALREGLERRGIKTEIDEKGNWTIASIPKEAIALFSERHAKITATARPWIERAEDALGRPLTALETTRIMQKATLFSRDSKKHSEDDTFEDMIGQWQQSLARETGQGLAPIATRILLDMANRPETVGEQFSPSSVAATAMAEVSKNRSAWTRAELMLEISKQLPVTGVSADRTAELIDKIADLALATDGVTQVSGRNPYGAPAELTHGVYDCPAARKYATPGTLEAEDAIRQTAITKSGWNLTKKEASAWLDANRPNLGEEMRAVVIGLVTTRANLATLQGAAGTGKSTAAGAAAQMWSELVPGGKWHGLATGENAAQVLKGDGMEAVANIDRWLAAQARIAAGSPKEGDELLTLSHKDVVFLDESSMVSTAHVTAVRELVEAAGARILAAGDAKQLEAIAAGGVLPLLDGFAEQYTLSEVRRFNTPGEGDASLKIREGDPDGLVWYDKHGRLIPAETMTEALDQAGRGVAADIIEGLSTMGITTSNEDAARLAGYVREHLVAAGLVEEDGTLLPMDGVLAGVGDKVMTRQIDGEVGVLNRDVYTVTERHEDGSLTVVDKDGVVKDLPASYVEESVQSAYAGTVHAVQGMTLDTGHMATDGGGNAASIYVSSSRGRDRNTMYVSTQKLNEVTDHTAERDSPYAVLKSAMERENENRAARVEQELDDARNAGMSRILGLTEDGARIATRARLERHLDVLQEEGVLSTARRAELCADPATETLSRALRAVEQTGADPMGALRDAIQLRDLKDSISVAQVLYSRLGEQHEISGRTAGDRLPSDLDPEWAGHFEGLREAARDRARVLGTEVAEEAPAWATRALGAVPEDPMERLEWEARAGAVAAFREGTGFDDPERAISIAPGVSSTERRSAWWSAWEALGQPEGTQAEETLTDGQLLARVKAGERELSWAPPHADPAMRQSEMDAAKARRDATLAQSLGDEAEAARLSEVADQREAVARDAARIAEARSEWQAKAAPTLATADGSRAELERRGIKPGQEEDRTTAEEWLDAEREARREDDRHRAVTDADVDDDVAREVRDTQSVPKDAPEVQVDRQAGREPARSAAHEVLPSEPSHDDLDAAKAKADRVHDEAADRDSHDYAYEDAAEAPPHHHEGASAWEGDAYDMDSDYEAADSVGADVASE